MTLPTIVFEVGFTTGASTADYLHFDDLARGILDTNTWGPDSLWEDVSGYVRRWETHRRGARGEQRGPVWRSEAGRLMVELNDPDRRFDPTNLAGPYVSGGRTQVTPMRAVRLMAVWNGTTYPIFRGFADSWNVTYDQEANAIVTMWATDGTKVLSANERSAVAAVGAGENTGARVTRILNSAGWSATDRIVPSGNTNLQATTLEGPAWDELLLAQDTEIGEMYFDEQGRVVFNYRQAMMEQSRSINSQVTLGDSPVANVQTTVNLVRNPSVEIDTAGYTAGGSVPPTLARSSTRAMFGTWSLLVTWGTGGFLPLVSLAISEPAGTGAARLTVGKVYTASVYVYVPAGSPDVILAIGGQDIFGDYTTAKDQWVRLSMTASVASPWDVQLWPLTAPVAGQEVYIDGFQIEERAEASVYCDGTQASCEWDGTAHASSSRRLPELPYADVVLSYDDTTLANRVSITRVGGAEQVAESSASVDEFLIHTHMRTDLIMQTDAAAMDYANFVLYQSSEPELRFESVTIRPLRDEANLFPQVLSRRFGDRIRIKRRPPGGGLISREAFIRGISHESDGEQWITRWTLQSATKWAFLILDHATMGKLDENALGY